MASPPASKPSPGPSAPRTPIRYPAVAVVMALAVFGRSVFFDFVGFDDALHVGRNPYFHPLTLANVLKLWGEPYRQVYMPVTYMVLAAIARLGELPVADATGNRFNPYLFHTANVLVHAVNTLLVWLILRRLVRSAGAATLGAVIFAVHPIQAESVCWISSLKDLLSAMFAMSACLLYLQFCQKPRWWLITLASVGFALAILSKATAIVIPAVLVVLIAVYIHRRRDGELKTPALSATVPWKILSPLAIWMALVPPFLFFTRKSQGDAALLVWNPMHVRPLVACDAIVFYMCKLIWPLHLAIDYGRSPHWLAEHGSWWVCAWAATLLIAMAVLAKRLPAMVGGEAIFVVALAPVLGIITFEFQWYTTVADRYLYLPMLGVALLVAAIVDRLPRWGAYGATGIIIWMAVLGWIQAGYWQNSQSLFDHAVAVNPASVIGWQGEGSLLASQGKVNESIDAYHRALLTQPDDVQSLQGLWLVLHQFVGGRAEALARADMTRAAALRVLRKYPDNPLAHRELANALAVRGETAAADREFARAIALAPDDVTSHIMYGDALLAAGRKLAALEQYRIGQQLNPGNSAIAKRIAKIVGP